MKKLPCKECEEAKRPQCRETCEAYSKWNETLRKAEEARKKAEHDEAVYWSVRNTAWEER